MPFAFRVPRPFIPGPPVGTRRQPGFFRLAAPPGSGCNTEQLGNAIKNYYAHYSRYPLPIDAAPDETTPVRVDAHFTSILLGADAALNPDQVNFLPEIRTAQKKHQAGLKSTDAGPVIVDSWHNEFYLLLDADDSGDIDNPDPAGTEKKLYQGVLVFSAGPDKDPSTWEANATSWQTRPRGR